MTCQLERYGRPPSSLGVAVQCLLRATWYNPLQSCKCVHIYGYVKFAGWLLARSNHHTSSLVLALVTQVHPTLPRAYAGSLCSPCMQLTGLTASRLSSPVV